MAKSQNKPTTAPTPEQQAKAPIVESVKFKAPKIESKSRSNGVKGKIYEMLSKGEGLTSSTARKVIFENPDLDPGGNKSRDAIRKAQATARLNGFDTYRLRYGNNKVYYAVKPEDYTEWKKFVSTEYPGHMEEKVTA